MKLNKTLMIQGTGSGVGKSILTSALCRIFVQDGYKTAPYKAQNMALNSFVTPSGGEIGRAQAVQAQACKIVATVDMNPVLIKPSTDITAQIIVHGKPFGNKSAIQYSKIKKSLFGKVKESLSKLRREYEVVVIEGAGSPAEVNLRKNDIVNMSIAKAINSPVILVGDIDNGGVLAWIIGTLELLSKSERKLVKGIIINKFRGDKTLFADGVKFLERYTGIKVLGVIPYFKDIKILEEDSIPLKNSKNIAKERKDVVKISVIHLPHISNFTDFDPLEQEEDVSLRYVKKYNELGSEDIIIIPGTKNTIADLIWMQKTGIDKQILKYALSKKTVVIGICGGYQILGKKIYDKNCIESKNKEINGLGLLPIVTELEKEKKLCQITGVHIKSGAKIYGYEIHHGKTSYVSKCKPVFRTCKDELDGVIKNNIWGTYIHGVFDSAVFRRNILNNVRLKKGFKGLSAAEFDTDMEFDKLADVVRKHLDMKEIYKILGR